MQDSTESADAIWFARDLAEHLPNQAIEVRGNPDFTHRTAVVFGDVQSVGPGVAYRMPGGDPLGDADSGEQVPFESPDALWKVATVRLRVSSQYGLPSDSPTVSVGAFLPGPNFDQQYAALATLETVVAVVDLTRTYEWNPDLLRVARSGSLFGTVDPSGLIAFPALGEESAAFVGNLDTPARIAAEARLQKPVVTLALDPETGVPTRQTADN